VKLWSLVVLYIIRPGLWLLFRLLYGIEFHGLENLPARGAVIITPNHITYFDPFLAGLPFRRRVFFMTWSRIFSIPVISGCARALGAFPVNAEASDRQAIKTTQNYLRQGSPVMIFPEGARSRQGILAPFKGGAFRLAARENIPVMPVTINGVQDIWPPTRRWPRLHGKVVIYYHPVIYPAAATAAEVRSETERLLRQTRAQIISKLDPALVPPWEQAYRDPASR
jgi:1-acyl-sn-glycerol-3-phosphate acyltransferase